MSHKDKESYGVIAVHQTQTDIQTRPYRGNRTKEYFSGLEAVTQQKPSSYLVLLIDPDHYQRTPYSLVGSHLMNRRRIQRKSPLRTDNTQESLAKRRHTNSHRPDYRIMPSN